MTSKKLGPLALFLVMLSSVWLMSKGREILRSDSSHRPQPTDTFGGSRSPASVPSGPVQIEKPAPVERLAESEKVRNKITEERPMIFMFQKELMSYLHLQTKVFLSNEERDRKRELLSREELLRAVGPKLIQPTRSEEGMRDQDAALDMLLEALESGNKTVAEQVLREVIEDRQIEDNAMDRSAREQLAGIKAEVLYQWSALLPTVAPDLEKWLPGPISQKIWQNVLRMQASNLAESDKEASERGH